MNTAEKMNEFKLNPLVRPEVSETPEINQSIVEKLPVVSEPHHSPLVKEEILVQLTVCEA